MKIVAFLGYSGAGKTTSIYQVAKSLTGLGLRVGTIKHAHEPLSFDRRKKDTWLHSKSGASVVVAVSPAEMVILKKGSFENLTLPTVLKLLSQEDLDFVLIEGFYKSLSKRKNIKTIICASSKKQALSLLQHHESPLCILSKNPRRWKEKSFRKIPILSLPRDSKSVVGLISS